MALCLNMDIHRLQTAVNAQPRPTAKVHRPTPSLRIDQASKWLLDTCRTISKGWGRWDAG